MPTYKICYIASEGDFMMEVLSGSSVTASDNDEALRVADHVNEYFYDGDQLTVIYLGKPFPHMEIHHKNPHAKPSIIKYEIFNPNSEIEKELWGIPIVTDDNYLTVSEEEFIRKLRKEYTDYFKRKGKERLSFEIISYGVVEVNREEVLST